VRQLNLRKDSWCQDPCAKDRRAHVSTQAGCVTSAQEVCAVRRAGGAWETGRGLAARLCQSLVCFPTRSRISLRSAPLRQFNSSRCKVTNDSPVQPSLQQYFQFRCRDCGHDVGFRSRRRSFFERYLLPLFLLKPVRCGECFRRDYRLIFTPVHDRLSEASRITPAVDRPATPKRNVA